MSSFLCHSLMHKSISSTVPEMKRWPARSCSHNRQQCAPCCSYNQDVYERQRSPHSAPPVRSPPPPPPPPPAGKSSGGPRRNLLAGLFAIVGVAAGYQLSHNKPESYRSQAAQQGSKWVYADANGIYDSEAARQQRRRPILRVAGDTVDVLRPSTDQFMRMHISRRDPHVMIMEGDMGEFYTLNPAADKVDVRRMDTLLRYFADPRWELGMRRSPIATHANR